MNLKKMKRLDIIVGVIVLCVFFLESFLIIEYSTLPDDFKIILWMVFSFLIITFLTQYEISFCKKEIKKFAFLDKKTFIKPMKNRYFTSEDLGAFVIPVVLCTEDHCIYFSNPSRYPFFFEERKLDVLKLFEIKPEKNEKN